MSSDPLRELRSRKRSAKRGQPDPEPEPNPPRLRVSQGARSMPPSAPGARMTIDDAIREGVAELRHRPKWIRLAP
jgi:hypothetical protein